MSIETGERAMIKGQLANPPVVEAKPQGEANDLKSEQALWLKWYEQHAETFLGIRAVSWATWKAARVTPEATPSKPADPLHDKILAIKDDMEQAFTSVEHLLESDKNELLEAAKAVVMLWDIGSDDKLKDGVKALIKAIEAQEKKGISHDR